MIICKIYTWLLTKVATCFLVVDKLKHYAIRQKQTNLKLIICMGLWTNFVRFNIEKFYGSHEIIAQTNTADSNYQVIIDNPFSDQYNDNYLQPVNLTPNLSDQILLRSIGAQYSNTQT